VFLEGQQNWVSCNRKKSQSKKGNLFAEKMLAAEFFVSPGEILHILYEIANLHQQTCQIPASHCLSI